MHAQSSGQTASFGSGDLGILDGPSNKDRLRAELNEKNIDLDPVELRNDYNRGRTMLHQASIMNYPVPNAAHRPVDQSWCPFGRAGNVTIQAFGGLTREQYDYICYCSSTEEFWNHNPFAPQ